MFEIENQRLLTVESCIYFQNSILKTRCPSVMSSNHVMCKHPVAVIFIITYIKKQLHSSFTHFKAVYFCLGLWETPGIATTSDHYDQHTQ